MDASGEERTVATNRRARHDYAVLASVEAGLVLTGTEVKALREGKASLVDGYAEIRDGEAWMLNVHIPEYSQGSWTNHATRRKRKLLLHRQEITRLARHLDERGVTLIPMRLYFRDGRAKVDLAVAKGLRDYDKRQVLRKKQDDREARRAMRAANRTGGRGSSAR
ncbi:MAG: SsrA-binding protein SmpB [Microbacteriaceae bacterium]|jgi:SsrA-binding protein|nr:SsrA-binding protein SmpB [Microbacteriaceae bacterium]MCI1207493.1 SsrA-binding protein SmpB [Microbacteriaceae bacterium]